MSDALLQLAKVESKFLEELGQFSELFIGMFENAEKCGTPLSFGASSAKIRVEFILTGLKIPFALRKAMEIFIDRSKLYHARIAARDIDFLKRDAFLLFEGVPKESLLEISGLFDNPNIVTPSLLEQLWEKLTSLTVLSVKYVHWKRWGVDVDTGKEGYVNKYLPANPTKGEVGFSVKNAVALFQIRGYEVE